MLIKNGERIVFTGDSITDFDRKRPVGEGLWEGVGTGYVRLVHTLVNALSPREVIRISNTGVGGNNILDLEARWQQDVLDLNPDWVSVMIGVNDVWRRFDEPDIFEGHIPAKTYEETYRRLIERTLPRVKGMILMTPFFLEPNREDPMRKGVDELGAVTQKLAEEYGLVFVDVQAVFDGYLRYRHPSYLAWDRVHPNQVGAFLIARAFLDAVGFSSGGEGTENGTVL